MEDFADIIQPWFGCEESSKILTLLESETDGRDNA